MNMAVKRNLVAVAIAVLLSFHVSTNVVTCADVIVLPTVQVAALMDLFEEWSQPTEDVSSKLPGWRWFDPNLTAYDNGYYDPCYFYSWRGIFCDIVLNQTASEARTNRQFDARVIGITVSGTSIVGALPAAIWNFSSLVSLTLTENPKLSGFLPSPDLGVQRSSVGWTLKSLDLHGNRFSGHLPEPLFEWFNNIEDLDLSNNHLEGSIPVSLGFNGRLRSLILSNNKLSGSLPGNITGNWSKCVTADISNNKFTGNMPNLSSVTSLHTLNFSHNNFDGPIDINDVLHNSTKESLTILDLSNNKFTGPMPNFGEWSRLASLNLSYNKFDAGACPSWLSNLTTLGILGLSGTSLTGEINMSMFSNLIQLKSLELDDNNISGILNIDSFVEIIYSGPLLNVRLKGNQIREVVSVSSFTIYALQNISFELQGNPYCNNTKPAEYTDIQRCLCEQRCYDTNPYSKTNKKIIIGSAIAGSSATVMLIIATILYWKNRRVRRDLLAVHKKFAEYDTKPTLFAYNELQKATRDFHPDNKLGEGGFGAVYKGTLADDSVVAVKQLRTEAQQNMDDFLNEVVLLTTVKHRNLVKLKGCCVRGDRRLLVYEFVDNYDLAETLFERKGNQLVTWPARYNICLGVAEGLRYLHGGVDRRIIHRDIKANNILLDHNLHPKIADFGLAMLFPNEDTHVTIVQIAGTKGYLAPEYATRGQVSDKVDVFSFGVLALEVVSGRKNISFDVPPNEVYLTDWAWKLNEEGRLMEVVDPAISIQVDEEAEVHRVITTALACIQTTAERRPSMAHVVGMLQGDIEITEPTRGHRNENQAHHLLLGLSSSATTLMPVDEESQALHLGESSSSTRALIELTAR